MLELTAAAIFLTSVAAIVCVSDFRKGILIVAGTGLAQDLVRKMAPGQPTYLMGLVFVVFAASLAGAVAAGSPRWWRRRDWNRLRGP